MMKIETELFDSECRCGIVNRIFKYLVLVVQTYKISKIAINGGSN